MTDDKPIGMDDPPCGCAQDADGFVPCEEHRPKDDAPRKLYSCSVCHEPGHSRRTCPQITGRPIVETRKRSRRGAP